MQRRVPYVVLLHACMHEDSSLLLPQAPAGGEQHQAQQAQQAAAAEGPKDNSNPAAAAAAEGRSGLGAVSKLDQAGAADGCGEQAAAQPAQPAKRPRLALRK